jgi:DNA-binding MarR family transcriptional regulator
MDDLMPDETTIHTWVLLARAGRTAVEAVEAELKAAGLPPLGWYDVLWELERADDRALRPFEIESRLLLAQYNLSRLLKRMEAAGLVDRRPSTEDGRGHIITITEAGAAMRRRMWPVYARAIEAAFGARLSGSDMLRLSALLERVVRGAEEA